ncbi:unnamed protein product [Candida verbasci]|uniref:Major facilitator superfamily (MFS) profile domain-containing protein n=1 Tax=Candida verbasci TaxID=1227364 RepID=A0A9W4TVA9_9ASCO|nr:unnamed protein product [Candida verbasci]
MTQLTIREQLEGFPLFQMIVLGTLRLTEPISFSSIFAYLYFMIKSFNIASNDANISKYSGYLASAFSISQFLTSIQWGKASNKYGRKRIILLGCFGTAISMVILGISTNFYTALLARILMGLLNGNVAIMRTAVGEIAHEKRHQGIAFSNLSLIWSFGKSIGGFLGGWLTDVDKFRETQEVEERFPFIKINLIVAAMIIVFMLQGWLFLEETHEKQKNRRDIGLEIGDFIRRSLGFEVPQRPWQIKLPDSTEEHLVDDFELSSFSTDSEDTITDEKQQLLTKPIIIRIINNFLMSFSNIIYTDFFPIFLAKTLEVNHLKFPFDIKGGFGYSSKPIGNLISITGIIGVVMVSLLFPIITKHFELLTSFRLGLSITPFIYITIPLIIFTLPEYNPKSSYFITNSLLYINSILQSFLTSINFSQMFILIHSASPKQHRAIINSYTISCTSLARFIAPLIFGWIMANFDHIGKGGLSWWFLAIVCFISYVNSFFLKESDEIIG